MFLTILLTGCGESEQIEVQPQKNVTELDESNEILKKLGVNIEDTRISLDINKTADFLKQMEIEIGRAHV